VATRRAKSSLGQSFEKFFTMNKFSRSAKTVGLP
jgi:hypothetical protein